MPRRDVQDSGATGIALSAAAGFAAGLFLGVLAGEWVGNVHPARLKRLAGRFRRLPPAPALEPRELETAVRAALRDNPATRRLAVSVQSPGPGLIELTGEAPTGVLRRTAGEIARSVDGADVVVNRVLVRGEDLPPENRTTG